MIYFRLGHALSHQPLKQFDLLIEIDDIAFDGLGIFFFDEFEGVDHILELVFDLIVSLLTVLDAVVQSFIKNFDNPPFEGFQVGRVVVLVCRRVGVSGSDDLTV